MAPSHMDPKMVQVKVEMRRLEAVMVKGDGDCRASNVGKVQDGAKVQREEEDTKQGHRGGEEESRGYSTYGTTMDGSVDRKGRPAIRNRTGRWSAGFLLLVNQGLATLAFFGVGVNLVLFLTRVLQQSNADAANNVSKWTGTVYLFSLVGAFLSDSYWGRYKTCAIFQSIFVMGLVMLSLSSYTFLIKPKGCGNEKTACRQHSNMEVTVFYMAIYMVALGNGGYQPNVATFGADQFDEEDGREKKSKVAFFSYFYLALNLGSLFSNTILSYFEDEGKWVLGFWASTASAFLGLLLFLAGTPWFRHFRPVGNPLARVAQVVVAASRKWMLKVPDDEDDLYEVDAKASASSDGGARRLLHTKGFRFLDRAAVMEELDEEEEKGSGHDPWRLCTVTQVEELKCVLRLLPIWLCTILYSVVFTQMASIFVEQGAAMNLTLPGGFRMPPATMSAFDILAVAAVIFLNRRLLQPLFRRLRKDSHGLSELERMGVGLVIAVAAMLAAGVVEHFRLKHRIPNSNSSDLSIMWQVPQYVLVGASEVFMYVGQLEFFNGQTPDGLKSFGSALCMTSMSLGNYVSSIIVTMVMEITGRGGGGGGVGTHGSGWIPSNLNEGHLDRFYLLLAILASVDFIVYLACAKCYKAIKLEGRGFGCEEEQGREVVEECPAIN